MLVRIGRRQGEFLRILIGMICVIPLLRVWYMKGVDLRTVQELLDHKSITMTCRYAHLSQSHLKGAVERL
jgi:integrase